MTKDRVVICMKWGTLYAPDYVNVLYNACRANITGPFRFVCLTENTAGLRPEVETFPIPDMGLTPAMWKKGGWPKLSVLAADLYGLTGRALFIDLDSVILGSLDAMFDMPAPLVVIDVGPNWRPGGGPGAQVAGTGIFAFDLGQNPDYLDQFLNDPAGMVAKYRIEQVYLQDIAQSIAFWPPEWVVSFKYHLRRPVGIGLLMPPRSPGAQTRVIAFHGDPRPSDLLRHGWWGIFPHVGRGPVRWMVNYWRDHGGTLP